MKTKFLFFVNLDRTNSMVGCFLLRDGVGETSI
jgi:hypothetical protein